MDRYVEIYNTPKSEQATNLDDGEKYTPIVKILFFIIGSAVFLISAILFTFVIAKTYYFLPKNLEILSSEDIKAIWSVYTGWFLVANILSLSAWLCKRSMRLILGKKWSINTVRGRVYVFPIRYPLFAFFVFMALSYSFQWLPGAYGTTSFFGIALVAVLLWSPAIILTKWMQDNV